jgi:predicted nucleic acid-binding protein
MTRPHLLLDASGLIALARMRLIEPVGRSVGSLHVTPEVADEATVGERPGAAVVAHAIRTGVVTLLDPADVRPITGLGTGETATIRRAIELGMVAVLDDLDARRAAGRLGATLTGTVAILVRLCEADRRIALRDALDELDSIGFRIAPTVRAWALATRPDDEGRSPRRRRSPRG